MNIKPRQIDYVVGVPSLFLISLLRRSRNYPESVRRIALLKTRGLGDAVLATVLLQGLRRVYPLAKIDFIGDQFTFAIAPLLPNIDSYEKINIYRPLQSTMRIRRQQYDLFIDLGAWPRIDALISATSKSSYVAGFVTDGQSRHYAYDQCVEHRSDCHEMDNYKSLGIAVTGQPEAFGGIMPKLNEPDSIDHYELYARVGLSDSPYVFIHPWAGGSRPALREWPSSRWLDLCGQTIALGYSIVLTGGGADQKPAEQLRSELLARGHDARSCLSLAGFLSVSELFVLLKRKAKALVSVNTGVMHIGAAAGVPTVGLCGPTNPERWGPVGPNAFAVSPSTDGCGFLNLGFEYHGHRLDCMDHITVEHVFSTVRQMIDIRRHH